MKEFDPQRPKDTLAKHKLIAYTTLLSVREFLGDEAVEKAEIVIHSSKRHARSLTKELSLLGLRPVAVCDGEKCLWNSNGVSFDPKKDKELDIPTNDAYNLKCEVVVLDEVRDFVAKEDVDSLAAKIVVEAGNYITKDAKDKLRLKGVQVIPRQFFDLYPLESARPGNVGKWSDRLGENWEKTAAYAKEKGATFERAFEYLVSQRMV